MFLFRDKQIPLNRELRPALQAVWSIGWLKSLVITTKLGFSMPFFINNLNMYTYSLLFYLLKCSTLSEVRLKRIISTNIKALVDINSYKGFRHASFLPVRGQRTRTNGGTQKRQRLRKNGVLWS